MFQTIEQLGLFYLGKISDSRDLLLYPSKHFTTHAVCLGMTGSGKTGLAIGILEEAGLDQIPSISIDPKGDLGNLLLTFPHLAPEEFLPWIDEGEAHKKTLDPAVYAKKIAQEWKEGLETSGITAERIKTFRNSVELCIYTPASNSGIPLSILNSFTIPPKEILEDSEALRTYILSITSGLLGLLGISADPLKSKEHILISTIFENCWKRGENLDLNRLIQLVQKPSFTKIGALDLETFFPAKERLELSISLNNLLASPGFKAWREGEPLDIKNLLYTPEGKPKCTIISIAHLADSERMFFVTIFLNELLSWVRRQPGTSSLRALFYMDEVFGYFPPVAMPPSKTPMLTLLKQARAYGLGIILSTQNPVDLDYKGLSNCGTWFIGKLQTERDRSRVLDGLRMASNGEIDAKTLEHLISSIGKRTFVMRSIYEKDPVIFQTRWTMSYLRGPLTLSQISKLSQHDKTEIEPEQEQREKHSWKPLVPLEIPEVFVNIPKNGLHYQPQILGVANVHFLNQKNKIDVWKKVYLIAPAGDDQGNSVDWNSGKIIRDGSYDKFQDDPMPQSTFGSIPPGFLIPKNYKNFKKALINSLYQYQNLKITTSPDFNLTSNPEESEGDFRARLTLELRSRRDEEVQKIRDKYSKQIEGVAEKLQKARQKLSLQKQQAGLQKAETLLSVGSTILGTLFGRGVTKGTINQAGTTIRRAGKISKEQQEAENAEKQCKSLELQLEKLKEEVEVEIGSLTAKIQEIKLVEKVIKPKKSDISVEKIALIWLPGIVNS